jgi:hypothetical protein
MVKAIGVAAALALLGVVVTLGRAAWKSRKWKGAGTISGVDPWGRD